MTKRSHPPQVKRTDEMHADWLEWVHRPVDYNRRMDIMEQVIKDRGFPIRIQRPLKVRTYGG